MRVSLIFILCFVSILAWSQKDTTLYFGVNGKMNETEKWQIKKVIDYRSAKKVLVKTNKIDENGGEKLLFAESIKMIDDSLFTIKVKGKVFSNGLRREFEDLGDGRFKFTDFQNGSIRRSGFSKSKVPLIFDREVAEYHLNGNKKSVSVYKNNELISNKNWLANGDEYIENIYYSVDQEPLFPRGMSHMHNHIIKTFNESQLDISQADGTIKVGFVVMEDGRINGVQILEGISSSLNTLAVKAFSTLLGEWVPAKLDGKNVRYFQIFPINFIYTQYDFDYVDLRGSMLYWEIN